MDETETIEVFQDGNMFFVRKMTYTNKNPDFGHGVGFSITEDGINTIASHAPIVKELKAKISTLESQLRFAAEMAYKSEVEDTEMTEYWIGEGKEYFDKEDWIQQWIESLK